MSPWEAWMSPWEARIVYALDEVQRGGSEGMSERLGQS